MKITKFLKQSLLPACLTVAFVLGAPAVLLAQGNGKGGGKKGGDEEPPTPPPVTFLIQWVNDFLVNEINQQGDLIGTVTNQGGYANWNALIYNGQRYIIDPFFVGTGSTPRVLFDMSNRQTDGSLYLCGSCDTVDGVRGWRMRLSPSTDGLVRSGFTVLQPDEGDDVCTFTEVNVHGEAVGYSYSKAEIEATGASDRAVLYQSDLLGVIKIRGKGGSRMSDFVLDSGAVISNFPTASGEEVGIWLPGTGFQPMLSGESLGVIAVNELGEFLVRSYETIETNQGTESLDVTYYYDGTLNYLTDRNQFPRVGFTDLNSMGDLISTYYASPNSPKKPGRNVNEVHFTDLGATFLLDDMLDISNSAADVDLWFESSVSTSTPAVSFTNDSGQIAGRKDSYSFVLTPVFP